MATWIPFGERLQKRLGNVFEQAGFHLYIVVSDPQPDSFEIVEYIRYVGESGLAERVTFHGAENLLCELREEGEIYAYAMSANPREYLFRLKDLIPNRPADLDWRELSVWVYKSNAELDERLDEIADLVENRLFTWFEKPYDVSSD